MRFSLTPRTDIAALRARYARDGHVAIEDPLPTEQAEALAAHLHDRDDWLELVNAANGVAEIPVAAFAAMAPDQRAKLDELVHPTARDGFQFRFRSIRAPDEGPLPHAAGRAFEQFAQFLNGAGFKTLVADVTGLDTIRFIDAQATIYTHGHFLNSHDDAVAGKNREAAYVFGLTKGWRDDWGAQLLFPHGGEVRGFRPAFNSLRLFAVPRPHLVSYVPPYVTARRLSVTGWLRSEMPSTA